LLVGLGDDLYCGDEKCLESLIFQQQLISEAAQQEQSEGHLELAQDGMVASSISRGQPMKRSRSMHRGALMRSASKKASEHGGGGGGGGGGSSDSQAQTQEQTPAPAQQQPPSEEFPTPPATQKSQTLSNEAVVSTTVVSTAATSDFTTSIPLTAAAARERARERAASSSAQAGKPAELTPFPSLQATSSIPASSAPVSAPASSASPAVEYHSATPASLSVSPSRSSTRGLSNARYGSGKALEVSTSQTSPASASASASQPTSTSPLATSASIKGSNRQSVFSPAMTLAQAQALSQVQTPGAPSTPTSTSSPGGAPPNAGVSASGLTASQQDQVALITTGGGQNLFSFSFSLFVFLLLLLFFCRELQGTSLTALHARNRSKEITSWRMMSHIMNAACAAFHARN